MIYNGKLVELPRKGEALIITDLHGNLTDYKRYEFIWKDFIDAVNHVIITGDFIHPTNHIKDASIEILESLKYYFENNTNFHVLLGNHEWCHLALRPIYKLGVDQTLDFESKVQEKYDTQWLQKMDEYRNSFEKLPIAVKTDNKVLISHIGPANNIKTINDIINITNRHNNQNLDDMLWNTYPNYTSNDVTKFLEKIDCKVHIVGRTRVNGVELIGKNQLIISSSDSAKTKTSIHRYNLNRQETYNPPKKAYIELNLESTIRDANDILKMVKYL